MLATALIIFREVFEIAIILSIVMAATKGLASRNRMVVTGLLAGILGSLIIAYFAGEISSLAEGVGQELFNAGILVAASFMIGWTVLWMRKHAKHLKDQIHSLGKAISHGSAPLYSMSVVIALAVLREGSEIVLFIYGLIASKQPLIHISLGAITGFAGGTILGFGLYKGMLHISPKYIFFVTSWLLVLLAAGLCSIAAGYVISAGYFTNLATILWDSSGILPESSLFGQTLHILIGYSERPMVLQLICYIVVFLSLSLGISLLKDKQPTNRK